MMVPYIFPYYPKKNQIDINGEINKIKQQIERERIEDIITIIKKYNLYDKILYKIKEITDEKKYNDEEKKIDENFIKELKKIKTKDKWF